MSSRMPNFREQAGGYTRPSVDAAHPWHYKGKMQNLRFILMTIICWGIAVLLGKHIFIALKTGKIHHTDTESVSHKTKSPFTFWSLITIFSIFIAIILLLWLSMINDIINS